MTLIIVAIAYHAVLILGLLALLALIGAGVFVIIRIAEHILERYLIAKKIYKLFREFMIARLREESAPERKSRK